jgi:glycosyltransferase involved in cell wall biosynthesis
MAAIASLFDAMTLLITRRDSPGEGGVRLPSDAEIIEIRKPEGADFRRKLSVLRNLLYYVSIIAHHASKADVVHVPPPGDIPLLGMLVGLALRKRLLVRYCGSWFSTPETTVMNRVTRGLMRLFAGGRNVMLATGLLETPPAPGMHWIFTTAFTAQEVAAIRPELDRSQQEPLRLVYAGRLSHVKGVLVLLEALGALKESNPALLGRFELTLAGDGEERASLESVATVRGLTNTVRFLGQLDRSAVMQVLCKADVCVLPSLSESFCKARIEAMLCGTPVVTTEVGFGRELIGPDGERGWLARSGDAKDLARALARLLEEKRDWPALRRRCRAFAERFTLDAWTNEIGRLCASQWGVSVRNGKLAF